jgi:iron complex transport system substrate-binding protein
MPENMLRRRAFLTKTLTRRPLWVCLASIILLLVAIKALPIPQEDKAGGQTPLPAEPRRIIALAPSITEIIFALGQGQRLQGVSDYSDFPPQALALTRIGSHVKPNLERILALHPDLCIGVKDHHPPQILQRLDDLRVPVYLVDPRNLQGVMDSILKLGELLGASPRAQELVADMRRRIERVKSLVAQIPERPKVFFQIGLNPLVAVGSNTFIHELITTAGGENITAGDVPYPQFSREQVLALHPDVIIIASMARGGNFARVQEDWSRWPHVPAVRNRRIHLVDSNIFNRPTPRLVEGLELLCGIIHPQLRNKEK